MRFRSRRFSFQPLSTRPGRLPRLRSRVVGGAFSIGFAVLAARAMWVQGINDGFYQKQGELRQVREFPIHAMRGRILDRDGRALAVSLPTRTLWMDAADGDAVSFEQASAVGKLLGIDGESIEAIVASRKSFAYLKRQVPEHIAQEVMRLGVPGVCAQPDYRRFYPEGNIVAQVTGFAGVDGSGLEGIEKIDDSVLTGRDGSHRVLRNAGGQVIDTLGLRAPAAGKDVKLTIDQPIQYATFKALREAVQRTDARSGSAVVLDAHTGEILAMANWPSFDPNSRARRAGNAVRNHAVTNVFEPGSVMKPVTIALALQRNAVSPESLVPTDGGKLHLDGAVIHDDRDFGTLTVGGVVQKSSNVGDTRGPCVADAFFLRASRRRCSPCSSRWSPRTAPHPRRRCWAIPSQARPERLIAGLAMATTAVSIGRPSLESFPPKVRKSSSRCRSTDRDEVRILAGLPQDPPSRTSQGRR